MFRWEVKPYKAFARALKMLMDGGELYNISRLWSALTEAGVIIRGVGMRCCLSVI